jgi:predicted NUDIX family NTP pyrophosphohydrolase
MPKLSAGLLVYRKSGPLIEVLLVHPGGPYFAKKDLGAWSIPKGEYAAGDDPMVAAFREFQEETGFSMVGETISLDEIKQPGGKVISAWAIEGDCCAADARSNTFSLEWPPRSGKMQDFPEVDRAEWFAIEHAYSRILKDQVGFLNRLAERVKDVPCP